MYQARHERTQYYWVLGSAVPHRAWLTEWCSDG